MLPPSAGSTSSSAASEAASPLATRPPQQTATHVPGCVDVNREAHETYVRLVSSYESPAVDMDMLHGRTEDAESARSARSHDYYVARVQSCLMHGHTQDAEYACLDGKQRTSNHSILSPLHELIKATLRTPHPGQRAPHLNEEPRTDDTVQQAP